jgi:hypothetical protein
MTRGKYFIQYYLLERYFSILSESGGRCYRSVGSNSGSGSSSGESNSGSSSSEDCLDSGSGRRRWRLSRHE